MSFIKGNKHGANSSRKGIPNKSTKELREALTSILTVNLDEIEAKLLEVAQDNPAKYVELLLKIAEYSLPKMQSTQVVEQGQDGMTYKISFTE